MSSLRGLKKKQKLAKYESLSESLLSRGSNWRYV